MTYDLGKIRQLLEEGFSEQELRTFVFEHVTFRPVHRNLKEIDRKSQIVQQIVDHADRKGAVTELLEWAKQDNPAKYEALGPYERQPQPTGPAVSEPGPEKVPAPSFEQYLPPLDETSQPDQNGLRIFLCHASEDKQSVRLLYKHLQAAGFKPWLDEEDLLPGQVWQHEIPKAIQSSAAVLVCLSQNSIKKDGYVRDEITYALDIADQQPRGTIFFIPTLLEACEVPERLGRYQWVNLFEPNNYERLLKALQTLRQAPPPTKPKPSYMHWLRDPIWQTVGVMVALVALGWAVYTFYNNTVTVEGGTPIATVDTEATIQAAVNTLVEEGQGIVDVVAAVAATLTAAATATPTRTGTPTNTPLPPNITASDGASMVLIPGGSFEMGSEPEVGLAACRELYINQADDCQRGWYEDEVPVHSVTLVVFYIDQYEVTNAQYAAFLNEQGNQAEGGATWLDAEDEHVRIRQNGSVWQADDGFADHPVVEVSWYGAKAYCEWRGDRLPSEAEWEWAARGSEERQYPWGDDFDGNRLNFCDINCGEEWANGDYDDGYAGTAPVGSYPTGVSAEGVYDLAGNVWEWVSSEYRAYPYDPDDGRETLTGTNERVVRGGAWSNIGLDTRSADRNDFEPANTNYFVGLRCAR